MGYAYSPGLKVLAATTLRRQRRLPLAGAVLVRIGDRVAAEQVVMRTELPGPADMVNVASVLGVLPEEVGKYLVKTPGAALRKGELLAESTSFFGLFKTRAESPMDGTLEAISAVTGQVTVRGMPVPVEVAAYVDGIVVETTAGESVTIETCGAYVQGIFGIGGETCGTLALGVARPGDALAPEAITPAHRDAIIVGGSHISADTVRKAIGVGARAVIAGGMDDADLKALLGFELGVAITGHERLGITVVLTEGFGAIAMADKTFALLAACAGKKASVNGATQIRAGVMRPEIIVPSAAAGAALAEAETPAVLDLGTMVRAIREPYFGRIGVVTALPVDLAELPTESKARVLSVRFAAGDEATLPRANVEVIATS